MAGWGESERMRTFTTLGSRGPCMCVQVRAGVRGEDRLGAGECPLSLLRHFLSLQATLKGGTARTPLAEVHSFPRSESVKTSVVAAATSDWAEAHSFNVKR